MIDKSVYHVTVLGIVALSERLKKWPRDEMWPASMRACESKSVYPDKELPWDALMIAVGEIEANELTVTKYCGILAYICPTCRVIVDAALEGNNILPACHNGKYGKDWKSEK